MTPDFEQPKTQCPRCLAWVEDFDGFGVLAHTKDAYPDGCGYCSHPSRTGGVCGICGDAEPPPVEGFKRIRDLMQTPTTKRGC